MICAAFLLAASLACDSPDLFFRDATPGQIFSHAVPAESVYDTPNGEGKILRVTTNTAAFYSALTCGFLERGLLLGPRHGRFVKNYGREDEPSIDYYEPTNAQQLAEAFTDMRLTVDAYSPDMSLDPSHAVLTLTNEFRVVSNATRFVERDQTFRMCDFLRREWFGRSDSRAWPDENIYPSILGTLGGRDLVDYDFVVSWQAPSGQSAGHDFRPEWADGRDTMLMWPSWRSLRPDGVFVDTNTPRRVEVLHRELVTAANRMSSYCGGVTNNPAHWLPATEPDAPTFSMWPTVTNAFESSCGPTNILATTNDTLRLSYRRACGLAWLLAHSDSSIVSDSSSLGELAFGDDYILDLGYSGFCAFAATNFQSRTRAYDVTNGWHFVINFAQGDFAEKSNAVSVVTNSTTYASGQNFRFEADRRVLSGASEGGLQLRAEMTGDEIRAHVSSDGSTTPISTRFDEETDRIIVTFERSAASEVVALAVATTNLDARCEISCPAHVRYSRRPTEIRADYDGREDDTGFYEPSLDYNRAPQRWCWSHGFVADQSVRVCGQFVTQPRRFAQRVEDIVALNNAGVDDDNDLSRVYTFSFARPASPRIDPLDEIFLAFDSVWDRARERAADYLRADVTDPRAFVIPNEADAVKFLGGKKWKVSNPETVTCDFVSFAVADGELYGVSRDGERTKISPGDRVGFAAACGVIGAGDGPFDDRPAFSLGGKMGYFLLITWDFKNCARRSE